MKGKTLSYFLGIRTHARLFGEGRLLIGWIYLTGNSELMILNS